VVLPDGTQIIPLYASQRGQSCATAYQQLQEYPNFSYSVSTRDRFLAHAVVEIVLFNLNYELVFGDDCEICTALSS
jgi:hypothetical protein